MQQVEVAPFDRVEMLDRLGGDDELLDDVLEVFIEECPRMMQELHDAVDGGEALNVRRTAHSIKGALLNISAGPAATEAAALEILGMEDQLSESAALFARLESEIERLSQVLSP